MKQKFQIGDKVRCSKRCPRDKFFSGNDKVINVEYAVWNQSSLYYLKRNHENGNYRSYELEKVLLFGSDGQSAKKGGVKMFWNKRDKESEGIKVVTLPANGLLPMAKYYELIEDGKIPVFLVAIYNTEQLAFEIAKCLKNSTNDSGSGDNASK